MHNTFILKQLPPFQAIVYYVQILFLKRYWDVAGMFVQELFFCVCATVFMVEYLRTVHRQSIVKFPTL